MTLFMLLVMSGCNWMLSFYSGFFSEEKDSNFLAK